MSRVLYLQVDPELHDYYVEKVKEHNQFENNPYPNSGFDLVCPYEVTTNQTFKIDFKVKAAMYTLPSFVSQCTNDNLKVKDKPMGYYLYPRSSISKTAFRMSNSVGIIDSGYRGNLCAYFDVNTNTSMNTVESMQRLVQICSPTLEPFYVFLVDQLDSTERGVNGFGSSGI
jgi:dUTPase